MKKLVVILLAVLMIASVAACSNKPATTDPTQAPSNTEAANTERKVPLDWITPDGTYVTKEFVDYVKPLVIGIISPYYAAGLPKHLKLRKNIPEPPRETEP